MEKEIKNYFVKHPGLKIKTKELARMLNANTAKKYAALKESLYNLMQDGFLEKKGKRFVQVKSFNRELVGVFQIAKEGTYGFVILKNSNMRDVFIPEKYFNNAFHSDLVKVKLLQDKRGKNVEGKIVEIIRRGFDKVVGNVIKRKDNYFVEPKKKSIHTHFFIPKEYLSGADNGDLVIVRDIVWRQNSSVPEGKISEILGKAGSYNTDAGIIAHEFDIPTQFPRSVEKELNKLTGAIDENEISKRLDLRNENIFTIDPEDAKDFDDAVSIKTLKNGNKLIGIHIADVSHYVRKGTHIYNEAFKRGNSVYLVGKVIPMLPEKLSNKICSLVPNEDRLTFSVILELDQNAVVKNYSINKSIINSKRRFTYEEVQKIVNNRSGDFYEELNELNKIARKLRDNRHKKGSINFSRPEVKFQLDDNGKPTAVEIKVSQESNQLIEELMLLANKTIAGHFSKGDLNSPLPFVYRVHDKPDETKLYEFATFVKSLGYNFNLRSKNLSKEFQMLLEQVKGTAEEAVVNEIAIRTMAKAIYSNKNIGHYGLGFKYYTHFTSPIRRFPDLIVHLQSYYCLENNNNPLYSSDELHEICEHCSLQEKNAVNAERLSVKLKQIEFLKDKLGEDFEGIVSGVTNFGLFVEVSENLAEGLIRLRDIDDDYYEFDEKNYSLIGRRTKKVYRLGDKITVKLIRVDEERREVDFLIVE
ncbi:3'-to-5' exoribonuclease RNase R [hydrothermal vent metagenome]|uniref:exoribonuclease II n=1 Tax=hydrothermal vent metagenome TaxID=652676 RepID=A0A3B1D6H7_9ZZZZ